MSDDSLVQAFFEEADDLLADFEAGLLRLETAPDDAELLNRIFRNAHTLKGNSAMLGFEDVAHFTHALEDLLDQLRKGQRAVTPRVVDALLRVGRRAARLARRGPRRPRPRGRRRHQRGPAGPPRAPARRGPGGAAPAGLRTRPRGGGEPARPL